MSPLSDKPVVFFGHSMGAMIAFELTRALRSRYGREPQAIFVADRAASHIPDNDPASYNLPYDEFT